MQNNPLKNLMALCLRKPIIFSFILCLSAAFGILGNSSGAQALTVCHGDPIVILSNGTALDATIAIAIDSSQLGNLQVNYTFHVPSGVRVQRIIYTGGSLAGRENVKVNADQATNSYSEQVLVTSSISTSVTATFAHQGAPKTAVGMTNMPISLSA